jgi:hypothetical protein
MVSDLRVVPPLKLPLICPLKYKLWRSQFLFWPLYIHCLLYKHSYVLWLYDYQQMHIYVYMFFHVCEYFATKIRFHGQELLAPRPTPKLEDHPLSAVRDCLFNIFTATLHTGGRSSIRNLRTRLRHSPVFSKTGKSSCPSQESKLQQSSPYPGPAPTPSLCHITRQSIRINASIFESILFRVF